MVENLPAMQETWVQILGLKDPLEKGIATHSSILAWRIPRREEPGGLQSFGSQRAGHDWETSTNRCVSHILIFTISNLPQMCAENTINGQSTESPSSKLLPKNETSTDSPVPKIVCWVSLQPYHLLLVINYQTNYLTIDILYMNSPIANIQHTSFQKHLKIGTF